ncbi:MAG: tetratricopeptide repeat protein, partial [Acidobacteria bacterium]|nr:tetratricopeptide repeat protein [Acidobacteriota bacterium]
AALEWGLENDPRLSLRIAASINKFWTQRGYLAEGYKWLKKVLDDSAEDLDPRLRAKALAGIGYIRRLQGDLEGAGSLIDEGLRLSREIGDEQLECVALGDLGIVKLLEGDLEQAKQLIQTSLEISREINDQTHIAFMLNNLGEIARQQNDFHAAGKFYEESLSISKQEDLRSFIAVSSLNLASVACLSEDNRAARSYSLEALRISEELGDKIGAAHALDTFAAAAGLTERAALLFGAAQSIYDKTGHKLAAIDQKFKDEHLAGVMQTIGEPAFEKAFADGCATKITQAITLARETEKLIEESSNATIELRSGTRSYSPEDEIETDPDSNPGVKTSASSGSGYENYLNRFRKRRAYFAIALLLLLAAGAFLAMRYFSPVKRIGSIAVMPFSGEGKDLDSEYLVDGFTENLIRRLSRLPKLAVKARGSVFEYKGKNEPIKKIGNELRVDAVILGKLTQIGDKLILEVDLVDTATENTIWSKTYDRRINQVSSLQSEIARNVSDELGLGLTEYEKTIIGKSYTTNAEAERLYMKGLFF